MALVQQVVASELQWLFREQTPSDLGVDAQIEVLKDGKSSGRLFAVQIKAGDSYFRERTAEGVVYRDDRRHLEYWLNHSLPVVLVLCRPGTGEVYWQHINSRTTVRTPFGCRMFVPLANRFDSSASSALAGLVSPPASEAEGEFEIPWTEILPALETAAQDGDGTIDVGGLTYECRLLNAVDQYCAILVGAESASPQVAILRISDGRWSTVGHIPVQTRGADSVPTRLIPGTGGVAFVVRAPEGWGTGTLLEATRWYWVEDGAVEVLRYPTNAYVVDWGLNFNRFISASEIDPPDQLTDGQSVRVAFTIRYTPRDAEPDGPEAIELKAILSVVWQENQRTFREAHDSELTMEDANQLYHDTDPSFVARNINALTRLGLNGPDWAVKWIATLAEQSFPTDRQRLLHSIRSSGTG